MWHLKRIPKKMHLYWGRNKKLSYMKYLTIKSFMKHNFGFTINIFYPKEPCKGINWGTPEQKRYNYRYFDYFDCLKKFKNINLIEFDFSKILKNHRSVSEVHKSDLLRLFLLVHEGGFWSDFDILYTDSIENSIINQEENEDIDTGICFFENNSSIGFLFSSQQNKYYHNLLNRAYNSLLLNKDPSYQFIGRDIFNQIIYNAFKQNINLNKQFNVSLYNVPKEVVYPFNWLGIDEILGDGKLDKDSIGVHWFAGNDKISLYENQIYQGNIENYEGLIFDLMKEYDLRS